MIVGVPTESDPAERRVALTPPVASKLVDTGVGITVTTEAGVAAGWSDDAYREASCSVVESRGAVFETADVILQVRGLGATPDAPMDPYRDGQVVIGLLGPDALTDEDYDALTDREISAFALERIPRISRAQSMDVLTSMASLGGYKAAVLAAETYPALFPLQMTAAGTVPAAKVFVVGAGVAGLQAIATAQRLGARVRATDIRPEVSEEVESVGAEFVHPGAEVVDATDVSGYARAQSDAFYERQRAMMAEVVADSDVVITSAAVPGRPAPTLVTSSMIEDMAVGSVIVDLAAAGGGNCEPTRPDESVEHAGVTVLGPTNLPSTVSHTASQLFATNARNFLDLLFDDGQLAIDLDDAIVASTLITHEGRIRDRAKMDRPNDAGGPP